MSKKMDGLCETWSGTPPVILTTDGKLKQVVDKDRGPENSQHPLLDIILQSSSGSFKQHIQGAIGPRNPDYRAALRHHGRVVNFHHTYPSHRTLIPRMGISSQGGRPNCDSNSRYRYNYLLLSHVGYCVSGSAAPSHSTQTRRPQTGTLMSLQIIKFIA
ncbi:hypothetical protein PSTT_06215 [Puccinia striiformis]|uniref:Uncharacterized protein n=1 Tax=Puccinia striiformis TaxID=27350 RepID=A0A2S4VL53_9BASI|nr:hypothetical protein PSTT_06215 [Puccinia striiformis]